MIQIRLLKKIVQQKLILSVNTRANQKINKKTRRRRKTVAAEPER